MPVEERREPIRGGLTAAPCRRHPRQACSTPFLPSNWELLLTSPLRFIANRYMLYFGNSNVLRTSR